MATVRLDILEAENLTVADVTGSSDPFCVVNFGGSEVLKTAVQQRTLNPKWDEHCTIDVDDFEGAPPIELALFDKDRFGKPDPLGSVTLSLGSLSLEEAEEDVWLDLPTKGRVHVRVSVETGAEADDEDLDDEMEAYERDEKDDAGAAGDDDDDDDDEDGEDLLGIEVVDEQSESLLSIKPWLGAMAEPSNYRRPADADEPPMAHLELEFVHGYRAHDARANLVYTADGSILYHSAAVGIKFDPSTRRQMFFFGHTDDIVSLAYCPARDLVATGQMGKKPKICLWEASTMNLVGEIAGFHDRAVVALAFSEDGSHLASVGMDEKHSVALYAVGSGKMLAQAPGDAGKVLATSFIGKSNTEFVTSGIKHAKFWSFDGRTIKPKRGLFGRGAAITSVLGFAFANNNVLSANASGAIGLWRGNSQVKTFPAHKGPIVSIASSSDGRVATGGRDGTVKLWSKSMAVEGEITVGSEVRSLAFGGPSESKLLIGTKKSEVMEASASGGAPVVHSVGHSGELWGLAVSRTDSVFYTAAADGVIKEWDVASRTVKRESEPLGCDLRSIDVTADGSLIAVGSFDGKVFLVDASTLKVKKQAKAGVAAPIWNLCFSPDGSVLAVGSRSRIDLFPVPSLARPKALRGHHSYITHMDFNVDGTVLQSNSGDYELLYWSVETGQQITNSRSLGDEEWASFTCTLGWPVQGVWPKYSKGSDINSVARSNDMTMLAAGEDTGYVKLYRFPCIGSGFNRRGRLTRRPHSRDFFAHSSHVTSVRWTHDDQYLISTGGADRSVLQWRVVYE